MGDGNVSVWVRIVRCDQLVKVCNLNAEETLAINVFDAATEESSGCRLHNVESAGPHGGVIQNVSGNNESRVTVGAIVGLQHLAFQITNGSRNLISAAEHDQVERPNIALVLIVRDALLRPITAATNTRVHSY